jgi:hypothetical protein
VKIDAPDTARRALIRYAEILGALSLVAWIRVLVFGYVLHQPYPYNTFLFIPDARFSDFTIYYSRFRNFGGGSGVFSAPGHPFTYPAPCFIAYLLLVKLFAHPLAVYLCVVLVAVALGALVLYRATVSAGGSAGLIAPVVAMTALLAYPFMFLLDRGNIEGLAWILVLAGLLAFIREKHLLAGSLFAVAAAMKIVPGLFLLLLIPKRRYKELVAATTVGVGVTLASLAVIGPSIGQANRAIAAGLNAFREIYVVHYRPFEIGFDHSLFGFIKQVLALATRDIALVDRMLPSVVLVYGAAVSIGFGSLYLLRIRKLPLLNQLFALVIALITLPYVAYDYTLVYLYLPWGCLLVFLVRDVIPGRARMTARQALAFLAPCAVVFTPQSYLILFPPEVVSVGGQVKTVALMVLLWSAIHIPLPSSIFGETDAKE